MKKKIKKIKDKLYYIEADIEHLQGDQSSIYRRLKKAEFIIRALVAVYSICIISLALYGLYNVLK